MDNVNQPIEIDELVITHNPEERRFEATVGNERALVEYDLRDGVYAITHTYTPAAFSGIWCRREADAIRAGYHSRRRRAGATFVLVRQRLY